MTPNKNQTLNDNKVRNLNLTSINMESLTAKKIFKCVLKYFHVSSAYHQLKLTLEIIHLSYHKWTLYLSTPIMLQITQSARTQTAHKYLKKQK